MRSVQFPRMLNPHTITTNDGIGQGLRLLLNTRKGSLKVDPAFGCNVANRLFDNNDVLTETLMKEDIYSAIRDFAPYVRVVREDITTKRTLGKLTIEINGTSLLDYQTDMYRIEITNG